MNAPYSIKIDNLYKIYKLKKIDNKINFLNKNTNINTVLDGITLTIQPGEVVGIIGRNGCGKSTLLSIMSGIIEADSGDIIRNGKIASILELGMGFHEDLTGRENIYLKGELYGFSRKEIDHRLPNIIEFSGLDEYIDYPIRMYSSGMVSKLAFAIMINVDSDILLIDEVLSVGDTNFEMKAKEHFRKLSTSGKTVIIVSHQIPLLESICSRIIWLENGKVYQDGSPFEVGSNYLHSISEDYSLVKNLAESGNAEAEYKLAGFYRDGKFIEKDLLKYRQWLKRSADNQYLNALVEYGDLLKIEGNEEYLKYYESAANKGSSIAKYKHSSSLISNTDNYIKLHDLFELNSTKNAQCLFNYALFLIRTSDLESDKQKAYHIFTKLVELGHAPSTLQLAIMLRDGNGVPRDIIKMEHYLRKGIELNYIPAMTHLADIYKEGILLPRNIEKSLELYKLASSYGDMNSCYTLATLLNHTSIESSESPEKWYAEYAIRNIISYTGWLFEYDPYLGGNIGLLREASNSGNLQAQTSLINMCAMGELNDAPLLNETICNLEKLSGTGNIYAIRTIGMVYQEGKGVVKDLPKAAYWFRKGAQLGDAISKNCLGDCERELGNTAEAVSMYREASNSGNLQAQTSLINMCAMGELNDAPLLNETICNLEKLSGTGNIYAIRTIGMVYQEGKGVVKDLPKAAYWFRKGAQLGDAICSNCLNMIQGE